MIFIVIIGLVSVMLLGGSLVGLPIPVLIVVSGVIGYVLDGWQGLLVGIGWAYAFSLIIGVVAAKLQGGLVPKKVKTKTASSFIVLYPDLVEKVLPNSNVKEKQQYIETQIESIFKKNAMNTSTLDPIGGLSTHNVSKAAEELIQEEQDEIVKKLLGQLTQHIFKEMY